MFFRLKSEALDQIVESKSRLDVYLHPTGLSQSVSNDKAGLQRFARFLRSYQPELIVPEATGSCHRRAHRHLHDAGFHVAVMNPYRTRKFADMMGQLAKTDAIDAKSLALFAAMVKPEAKAPLPRLAPIWPLSRLPGGKFPGRKELCKTS